MQATITYLLTEEAQRAQMVATGQPVTRKQTITIDVPTDELKFYPVGDDGSIVIDLTNRSASRSTVLWEDLIAAVPATHETAPHIPALLAEYRDKRRAKVAKIAAMDSQMAAEIDADTPEMSASRAIERRASRIEPEAYNSSFVSRYLVDSIPLTVAAAQRSEERFKAAKAERARKDNEAELQRRCREEEKESDKAAFITAWVEQHACNIDKMRFADGVWPRSEIIAEIAEGVLDLFGLEADVAGCSDRNCPCSNGWRDTDNVGPAQYQAWLEIKKSLPENASYNFVEALVCPGPEEEDEPLEREQGVQISVQHGPFTFTRVVFLLPEMRRDFKA